MVLCKSYIKTITAENMRWAGYVAHMAEKTSSRVTWRKKGHMYVQ